MVSANYNAGGGKRLMPSRIGKYEFTRIDYTHATLFGE